MRGWRWQTPESLAPLHAGITLLTLAHNCPTRNCHRPDPAPHMSGTWSMSRNRPYTVSQLPQEKSPYELTGCQDGPGTTADTAYTTAATDLLTNPVQGSSSNGWDRWAGKLFHSRLCTIPRRRFIFSAAPPQDYPGDPAIISRFSALLDQGLERATKCNTADLIKTWVPGVGNSHRPLSSS